MAQNKFDKGVIVQMNELFSDGVSKIWVETCSGSEYLSLVIEAFRGGDRYYLPLFDDLKTYLEKPSRNMRFGAYNKDIRRGGKVVKSLVVTGSVGGDIFVHVWGVSVDSDQVEVYTISAAAMQALWDILEGKGGKELFERNRDFYLEMAEQRAEAKKAKAEEAEAKTKSETNGVVTHAEAPAPAANEAKEEPAVNEAAPA